MNLIYLIIMGLFGFSISSLGFQGIGPFLLNIHIYEHEVVHSVPLLSSQSF